MTNLTSLEQKYQHGKYYDEVLTFCSPSARSSVLGRPSQRARTDRPRHSSQALLMQHAINRM